MIGVRLPAGIIKKIGKIAEARSENRSAAIRWLIERALDSGAVILLLRQGRRRGVTGRIVQAHGAKIKAEAGTGACRMDRLDATTVYNRRKAAARRHWPTRQPLPAATDDPRRTRGNVPTGEIQ